MRIRSLKVVLASPLVNDAGFVREFTHPRITLEELPPHRPAGLEARLLALMQAGYLESGVTESVKIRRAEATAKGVVRWLPLKKAVAAVVAPSMLRPSTRYDLSDRLVTHPAAQRLFDRHQPALLVVSNPGLIFSEVPLLRTARQRGVRAIAIDPSWDNFTNKLIPVRRVDRLMVWNDDDEGPGRGAARLPAGRHSTGGHAAVGPVFSGRRPRRRGTNFAGVSAPTRRRSSSR